MVGGLERYYQIARCFRDEASRADRQPEFTQLDLEMSFVEEDDVIELMEAVMTAVFEVGEIATAVGPPPWPRLHYDDALARYGSDRPDTRFGLEIVDLSATLTGTEARVFSGALEAGGVVRAINAGTRELARSELDALTEEARRLGAKRASSYAFVEQGGSGDRRSPSSSRPRSATAIVAALRGLARRPAVLCRRPAGARGARARGAASGAGAALRAGRPPASIARSG